MDNFSSKMDNRTRIVCKTRRADSKMIEKVFSAEKRARKREILPGGFDKRIQHQKISETTVDFHQKSPIAEPV